MSLAQRVWSSTGSAERPMILAFLLSNSAFIFAMVPSSVVQTGVKSLGWENRTAHPSPIHWWKSMRPSVVSAWKLGAVSPMRSAMGSLRGLGGKRQGKKNLNPDQTLPATRPLEYSPNCLGTEQID